MVPRYFCGAAAGGFDVRAADFEGEGSYFYCAGCAEGAGGEDVLRGRDQRDGAGFDLAHTSGHYSVFGQRLRAFAEPGNACIVFLSDYGVTAAAFIGYRVHRVMAMRAESAWR